MNEIYSFIFIFIVAGFGLISHYFLHRLDTIPILQIQEVILHAKSVYKVHFFTFYLIALMQERHPGEFIGERAYQNLKALNDFGNRLITFYIAHRLNQTFNFPTGPKVTGSRANEDWAVNYILDYVNEVKRNASRPDDIQVQHQMVSGLNENWAMHYENIQNVIVRLQGEDDHALLINCHFDSVPGSPGASDDIVRK